MEPFAYTALGLLAGVLVTALVTMWQARHTHDRELVAAAIQAAIAEYDKEHDRLMNSQGVMLPMHLRIHWNVGVARLAADGKLTFKRLEQLKKESRELEEQTDKWSMETKVRRGLA